DVGHVPGARGQEERRPGGGEGGHGDDEAEERAPDHLAGAAQVVREVRRAQAEGRPVAHDESPGVRGRRPAPWPATRAAPPSAPIGCAGCPPPTIVSVRSSATVAMPWTAS